MSDKKTQLLISDATAKNWSKLKTDESQRLTARANKRKSQKRVFPLEYVTNLKNVGAIQAILNYIDRNNIDITLAILSLGTNLLKKTGIYNEKRVFISLREYKNVPIDYWLSSVNLPNNEFDILGLIYQAYLSEGKKNIQGLYYTPKNVADNITKNFTLANDKLFLDPCCGGGAFLLSVKSDNPSNIFGADKDENAVIISKINLLIKYSDFDFIPQVYCLDFLKNNVLSEKRFDYVATNPPWGAMNCVCDYFCGVNSKESFSLFFAKSYLSLKENGVIRFLFPQSALNVKTHKDIRRFIADNARIESVTLYDGAFSGVSAKYADIECSKAAPKETFTLYEPNGQREVKIQTIYETKNFVFNFISDEDCDILNKVKEKGKFSLENSVWGMGIVTGDNKKKLSSSPSDGMEKIYSGKDIAPYVIKPASKYILYDRRDLQQASKDEIYRAPEKLVYKFISNKPVFAYDNGGSLVLNSVNILIPQIPSMSIKTVMAFLNSSLFSFLYLKLFGEIKILKGNLLELTFPEISKRENEILTVLADDALNGNAFAIKEIDEIIFGVYNLTAKQIEYINKTVGL